MPTIEISEYENGYTLSSEQRHIKNIYECLLRVNCKNGDDLRRGYNEFMEEIKTQYC